VAKSSQLFTGLVYMLQFYQWFESYDRGQAFSAGNISRGAPCEIGPPELPAKLAKSSAYQAMAAAGLCPLCTNKRTNACVLDVSGFVFCYPCILKFVREHRRCPLTHLPCDTKSIVRIYDSPG
jgi:peroxin-12